MLYSVPLPKFGEACLPLISQGALVLVTSNGYNKVVLNNSAETFFCGEDFGTQVKDSKDILFASSMLQFNTNCKLVSKIKKTYVLISVHFKGKKWNWFWVPPLLQPLRQALSRNLQSKRPWLKTKSRSYCYHLKISWYLCATCHLMFDLCFGKLCFVSFTWQRSKMIHMRFTCLCYLENVQRWWWKGYLKLWCLE